ncbi:uncharacterized protein LOC131242843 isoform X2 [Magnolia sinica]|uniref:uncharacterized protein LOC131242843 isoform X2 n=1 Tax=Magnolia sinica TaxID=86752 RepID=UPI002657AEA0|nr:uncharacterized protein LOC131242843 isoform X2 [Magnolia sinica]
MPRKVYHGVDYDEEYDDYYDDYDYDYDVEVDEGETSQGDKAVAKSGLWRCSICTYDNDESLSSCDICGVFRDSSVNISNNGAEKKVDGMCKDSGVSVMAKSLFASSPRGTPKMDIIFQQLSYDFLSKGTNNSHGFGNIRGHFNDFQKAFMAPYCSHSRDIAPFKFDNLSPDDMVSAGKSSSMKASKANTLQLPPSKVSSSTSEMKILPNDKMRGSSSALSTKARQPNQDESTGSAVNEDKPQALMSNLRNLNLDRNTGSSKSSTNTRRPTSHAQYKPEKWMLPIQEEKTLTQLSLAIVGHVDSGKSTLSGRLLHLMGRISQKEMHKFEKESKQKGKGSFAYAWALDASGEERERGITMTVAVAYFDSKKYHVVVLDSPGHKDFVPNMISGATQADAAILVIDASIGSFEAGMEGNGGGQTKEHAQLIRSFGVEQIIVAVNKMDVVEYSKERFDNIKLQLGTFLRLCGFKESLMMWIPLSAMENQNLVAAASDARLSSWYEGPHLLDAIDSLQPPLRDVSKPLRMPICDVIKSHSLGQVAVNGKLEMGALKNGSKVLVLPSGDSATVRSIERDSGTCSIARAGDNISVSLQGIDGNCLMTGGVLCHPDFPVAIATCLELKILILDISMPILVGSQVEFHVHHAKEAAKVVRILSLLDPKTGKVSKKAPRCLLARQSAVIEVALDRAVCVEEFSNCKALGRVFLRSSGKTVAVGIINRVIEQN